MPFLGQVKDVSRYGMTARDRATTTPNPPITMSAFVRNSQGGTELQLMKKGPSGIFDVPVYGNAPHYTTKPFTGSVGGASQYSISRLQQPGQATGPVAFWSAATEDANAANEERYQQVVGGYDQLQTDVDAGLQGMGDQSRRDIRRGADESLAATRQDRISSGLANVTSTARARAEDDVASRTARLDEGLRREKLGYQTQIAGAKFGAMERREDVGPDPALLAGIAQGYGERVGYGSGGGSGGSGGGSGGGGATGVPATQPWNNTYDTSAGGVPQRQAPQQNQQSNQRQSYAYANAPQSQIALQAQKMGFSNFNSMSQSQKDKLYKALPDHLKAELERQGYNPRSLSYQLDSAMDDMGLNSSSTPRYSTYTNSKDTLSAWPWNTGWEE